MLLLFLLLFTTVDRVSRYSRRGRKGMEGGLSSLTSLPSLPCRLSRLNATRVRILKFIIYYEAVKRPDNRETAPKLWELAGEEHVQVAIKIYKVAKGWLRGLYPTVKGSTWVRPVIYISPVSPLICKDRDEWEVGKKKSNIGLRRCHGDKTSHHPNGVSAARNPVMWNELREKRRTKVTARSWLK